MLQSGARLDRVLYRSAAPCQYLANIVRGGGASVVPPKFLARLFHNYYRNSHTMSRRDETNFVTTDYKNGELVRNEIVTPCDRPRRCWGKTVLRSLGHVFHDSPIHLCDFKQPLSSPDPMAFRRSPMITVTYPYVK